MVFVKLLMNIQKFKTIRNKYAKKPRGMQKKAVFTENNARKRRGGMLYPSVYDAFKNRTLAL
jgi:ribosomal protein S13